MGNMAGANAHIIHLFLDIPASDSMEYAIINHFNLKTGSIPRCVIHRGCKNKYEIECASFEQLQKLMFSSAFMWKNVEYSWMTGASMRLKGLAVEILVPDQLSIVRDKLSSLGNVWQPLRPLGNSGLRVRVCTLILEVVSNTKVPSNVVSADNQELAKVYDVAEFKFCCVCSKFIGNGCQCSRPVASTNLLMIE